MKEYVLSNRKGLLLVLIAVLIMGVIEFQNVKHEKKLAEKLNYEAITAENVKVLSKKDIELMALEENKDKIIFYAKTFNINRDTLLKIFENKTNDENFTFTEDFDKNIINLLLDLENKEPSLFGTESNIDNHNKDYIVDLIKYFTNIYSDVDFALAAGIGQIESGYRSQYMLSCNNVFGGLSGGKLIKYKTIEYGVLRYIKLLNDSYFAKGLNTVSSIGRKYNPIIGDNGIKVANPTWVNNVTKAMDNYLVNEIDADITNLLSLQLNNQVVE